MKNFRSDNEFIYLERPHCEFYIPLSYFESASGFAEDLGQKINTLGVFNVGFFDNGKLTEKRILNIPTWIELFVYDYEIRSVTFRDDAPPVQCKVLKYFHGNKIMPSYIIQDSDNAKLYLKFIINGKIPDSIPYDLSLSLWRKNQLLNKVHLGVPSVIEELILSAVYRDKKNPMNKFAYIIGKDPDHVSKFDYTMASIRQICQYTSTFTAVTFEDIDSMITTSLNRSRNHTIEKESPIEEIIKM